MIRSSSSSAAFWTTAARSSTERSRHSRYAVCAWPMMPSISDVSVKGYSFSVSPVNGLTVA